MSAKVLVVDDIEFNLELTSRLLVMNNYAVVFARNGQEAINMTLEEMPDVILMDIGLPDIDGWTVVEQLKSIDDVKDIPIIALTAHDTMDHKDKAESVGCSGFVTKPIVIEELVNQIKKVI